MASTNSGGEPKLQVSINGQQTLPFLVDTGATHSVIGPHGAHLPLSNKKIRTQGFSGKMQTLKFTEPLDLAIDSQRVVMPLLYSESCPVNLLGRDILCKLNADIKCTPDGVLRQRFDGCATREPPILY